MKVFAEPPFHDFGLNRIAMAIKRYAPPDVQFVNDQNDADLIIIYAHGYRKQVWYTVGRQITNNRGAAIIQTSLRSTPNPLTKDWLKAWQNAKIVWSYLDLPKLCTQDRNEANFNFYHAPLGVDANLFIETSKERKYITGVHSAGWSRESLSQIVTASRAHNLKVLHFGSDKNLGEGVDYTGIIKNNDPVLDDRLLALYYSQCKYVSGLRRIEGFEMPVIEGLLCGARPICFDLGCYRTWFDGLAEFIPENGSANIISSLIELFKKEPKPVTDDEKRFVRDKFNWGKIVQGFWARII